MTAEPHDRSARSHGMSPTRSAPRRRVGGSTVVGFMVGLIFGLTIAVVVALFVTRAPVPFVDRTNRPSDRLLEPKSAADVPDPNKPMYSKNRPSGVAPAEAPPPPAEPLEDRASILERLFGKGAADSAGLPSPAAETPPLKGEPRASDAKAADARAAGGDTARDERDRERSSYLLQVGAFRSQEDADALKVRMALLGFEAKVASAEVNGQTMYRVRLGPYAQLDDVNKARAKLAENGVEASVVRQR